MGWTLPRYVVTQLYEELQNEKLHPNSGAPDYDVTHLLSGLTIDQNLALGTYNLAGNLGTLEDLTLNAPVNIYALSHDNFADFLAAEHLSLPNTIAAVLSDHNLAAHTALGLFDQSSDVDHDATTNFLAAEHLSLPNTIAAVLSDHNLAAHTALGLFDASSDVDHDATTNFLAAEHIDWTDAASNFKTTVPSGYAGIFMGGNVGIGTTGPAFKLDITKDQTRTADVAEGSAQVAIRGATNPTKKMTLGYDTNGNGFGYIEAGNYGVAWTNLVLQPQSGNVGIGTTAPTSKLQVVGLPIYANNAAAVAGGLTAGAFYRTGGDPDPVCVVH